MKYNYYIIGILIMLLLSVNIFFLMINDPYDKVILYNCETYLVQGTVPSHSDFIEGIDVNKPIRFYYLNDTIKGWADSEAISMNLQDKCKVVWWGFGVRK